MEGFHMITDLVKPEDWLTKLDLEGAYFLKYIDPSLQSVSIERGNIPVLLTAVWSILCLLHFHKVDKTSRKFSEGEGNQTDHISGQPAVPVQLSEYPTQPNGYVRDLFQILSLIINNNKSQMESVQEIMLLGIAVSTSTM